MDVWINLTVVTISQCICISNYHFAHLKHTLFCLSVIPQKSGGKEHAFILDLKIETDFSTDRKKTKGHVLFACLPGHSQMMPAWK